MRSNGEERPPRDRVHSLMQSKASPSGSLTRRPEVRECRPSLHRVPAAIRALTYFNLKSIEVAPSCTQLCRTLIFFHPQRQGNSDFPCLLFCISLTLCPHSFVPPAQIECSDVATSFRHGTRSQSHLHPRLTKLILASSASSRLEAPWSVWLLFRRSD